MTYRQWIKKQLDNGNYSDVIEHLFTCAKSQGLKVTHSEIINLYDAFIQEALCQS
jgi:hypothetical protein